MIKSKNKLKRELESSGAYQAGQDLTQMYQAGFFDCWRLLHKGRLNYKELNLKCLKSFEKRFIKRIQKEVDKKRGKSKNK